MYLFYLCYRCHLERTDFWTDLQRNWDIFYWLTGEIPPTMQALYDDLIQHYGHRITRGKCVLSFRNQVPIYHSLFRKYNRFTLLHEYFGCSTYVHLNKLSSFTAYPDNGLVEEISDYLRTLSIFSSSKILCSQNHPQNDSYPSCVYCTKIHNLA